MGGELGSQHRAADHVSRCVLSLSGDNGVTAAWTCLRAPVFDVAGPSIQGLHSKSSKPLDSGCGLSPGAPAGCGLRQALGHGQHG